MARKVVGRINERVIMLLGLSVQPGTEIFLGDTNVSHIKKEHADDYEKYSGNIEEIISSPDYVSLHPHDGSVQFIKVWDDHVMVAVRVTGSGVWFARTLFVMSEEKVQRYKQNPNILKKY